MDRPGDSSTSSASFRRELGLFDSTMIVMGSMIGSGIFIVSADISRTVGAPGYLMLVWLLTGLITVIAALSYGELAGMMPQAGGQYVYLREAYNPLTGFLYGWALFLVIQTGTIAAVGVAFAKFTAVIVPWFSEQNILLNIEGFKISAAQVLAIASIASLTFTNIQGLKLGKLVQDVFTISKTAALFGLILVAVLIGSSSGAISANLANFWSAGWLHASGGEYEKEALSGMKLLAAIGVAMVGSLFSSDAWNNITFTAGEVKEPRKNIPLSLALGTGSVIILYLIANAAYLMVLPLSGNPGGATAVERGIQFASDDRVGTAAISVVWGEAASVIMAILIMVSTFGCNNGLILAGARVYYAMAQDKLFFSGAGRLNRHSIPARALVIQAVWASLLCLSGTYSNLLDYVIFAVLIFYILTIYGIFILRRKRPGAERPYKAFGYPVIPAVYMAAAAAICVDLLIYKPSYTWPGLFIVLLGIPVYYLWNYLLMRK